MGKQSITTGTQIKEKKQILISIIIRSFVSSFIKENKTLFYIVLFLFPLSLFSQIKIRENTKDKYIDKKPIIHYDSLSDFSKQERNIDYYKYLNQELYLPPISKNPLKLDYTDPFRKNLYTKDKLIFEADTVLIKEGLVNLYNGYYNKMADSIKSNIKEYRIESNQFNPITGIKITNQTIELNGKISRYEIDIYANPKNYNKTYKIIDITSLENQRLENISQGITSFRFWLKTEENDTIYLDFKNHKKDFDLNPFIIKGFLEKEQQIYENEKLLVYKESDLDYYGKPKNTYIDIENGEKIILNVGDIWVCEEISFIRTRYSETYLPFYVLFKDGKRIKIPLNQLFDQGFLTLYELEVLYNEWLETKKAENEDKQRQIKNFQSDCQQYFSRDTCSKLLNNQIELGMTKEMIQYNYGEPYRTFISKTKSGVVEILSYGKTIFYFKNNVLVALESP